MTETAGAPQATSFDQDPAHSDATRYLCAAGYLDREIRESGISELVRDPRRAVAPSYGFDLDPVLRHFLRAKRLETTRDLVWTGAVVVAIVLAPWFGWLWVLTAAIVIPTGRLVATWLTRFVPQAQRRIVSLGIYVAVFLIVVQILSFVVTAMGALVALFSLGTQTGGGLGGGAGSLMWLAGVTSLAALLAVVVAFCSAAWFRMSRHTVLTEELSRRNFARTTPPAAPSPNVAHRLSHVSTAQHGNVTLCRMQPGGSYADLPFLGSGEVVDFWQFPFTLKPAADSPDKSQSLGVSDVRIRRGAPEDFSVAKLYENVRAALAQLADPGLGVGDQLPGLSLQDRLYVDGRQEPDSPYLVSGMPVHRLPPRVVAWVRDHPRGRERHYLVARVASWAGEVETSTVHPCRQARFHLVRRGPLLQSPRRQEVSRHRHDEQDDDAGRVADLGASLLDVVLTAPLAPWRLLQSAWQGLRRWLEDQGEASAAAQQVSYDYGARFGLREIASTAAPQYFQEDDAAAALAIIRHRVLTSVGDTLREFGFDTAEFDGQAARIIQNTTTNTTNISNSHVIGSSLATATGASASSGGAAPRVPSQRPTPSK